MAHLGRVGAAVFVAIALMTSACGGDAGRAATPAVASVQIREGDQTLVAGATVALSVTVEASGGASQAVAWTSDDETVARVGATGIVTAVAPGEARIIAASVADATVRDSVRVRVEAVLPGETLLRDGILRAPGAAIVVAGQVHEEHAEVRDGQLVAVVFEGDAHFRFVAPAFEGLRSSLLRASTDIALAAFVAAGVLGADAVATSSAAPVSAVGVRIEGLPDDGVLTPATRLTLTNEVQRLVAVRPSSADTTLVLLPPAMTHSGDAAWLEAVLGPAIASAGADVGTLGPAAELSLFGPVVRAWAAPSSAFLDPAAPGVATAWTADAQIVVALNASDALLVVLEALAQVSGRVPDAVCVENALTALLDVFEQGGSALLLAQQPALAAAAPGFTAATRALDGCLASVDEAAGRPLGSPGSARVGGATGGVDLDAVAAALGDTFAALGWVAGVSTPTWDASAFAPYEVIEVGTWPAQSEALSVIPASVEASLVAGDALPFELSVANAGTVPVAIDGILADASWLEAPAASEITIDVAAALSLEVMLDASLLPAGTYQAVIEIAWRSLATPSEPRVTTVPVALEVQPEPVVVSVTIDPPSATIPAGGSETFRAVVSGTEDTDVRWEATCGSVESGGQLALYRAPDIAGTCQVSATSVAHPSVGASAQITVTGGVGQPVWTLQFGTDKADVARAVAADAAGTVLVAGFTRGDLDTVPSGAIHPAMEDGIVGFVRAIGPDGEVLWTHQIGDDNSLTYAHAVAVSASGRVAVAGTTNSAFDGDNPSRNAAFVRVLEPGGAVAWTDAFGASGSDQAHGVAFDGAGNVLVVGTTRGALVAGEHAGGADGFVRLYGPDGDVLWTQQFGTSADDTAVAVAVAAAGGFVVVGTTWGDLAGELAGSADVFVRRHRADGSLLWSRQFGSGGEDEASDVALDGVRVVVAGSTRDSPEAVRAGFVRRYDARGLNATSHLVSGGGWTEAKGVAVDGRGNVLVVGLTEASLAGPNAGGSDVFVRKLGANLNATWTRQFGSPFEDFGLAVAVDPSDHVLVAGATEGDFEGGTVASALDAFVRKLSP